LRSLFCQCFYSRLSDSAIKIDSRRKMPVRREFLDFRDGEENRVGLSGWKAAGGRAGGRCWRCAGRTPLQGYGRDVIWETQLTSWTRRFMAR
jgi:hypothetical protein